MNLTKAIRLNMGGAKTNIRGFISIDAYDDGADVKRDCADTGYGDNVVAEISTSHMIEHLEPEHCGRALHHWFKILMPAGILTIRCPNAAVYLTEWLEANARKDVDYLLDWGTRNIVGWEGEGVGMWHRRLFSQESLRFVVERAGFQILRCDLVETRAPKGHFEYRQNGDILCLARKP